MIVEMNLSKYLDHSPVQDSAHGVSSHVVVVVCQVFVDTVWFFAKNVFNLVFGSAGRKVYENTQFAISIELKGKKNTNQNTIMLKRLTMGQTDS